MLGFLTASRDAGPLIDEAAADEFWHLLPRGDPCWAQKAVSEALAEFTTRSHPGRDHFRALLTVDQRSAKLSDALLRNYTDERVPSPSTERKSWQSALALSQSFARAYGYALWHIRGAAPSRGLREYAPAVLLRLIQHRQLDFLLRPFLTERLTPDCWMEIHDAFRYAQAQGLLQQHAVVTRSHEERRTVSTLEREYIHILLLELMNRGQVSPYDAFLVNRMLPRWSALLSLEEIDAQDSDEHRAHCLVVDQDRPEGLMRSSRAAAGPCFYLDPAPMLANIDEEVAALRNPADAVRVASALGRDRRLKLFRKLSAIYAPKPAPFNRRGQRRPSGSTVEAIVGLSHVMRMLRHERRRKLGLPPSALPEGDGVGTASYDDAQTSPAISARVDSLQSNATHVEFGVPHQVWRLKDRSDSGCRFRGRIGDSDRVVPGALVALREGEGTPWTLAVVRRRRARIGDRVDIGVEYLGRGPHGVALAVDDRHDDESSEAAKNKRNRFNALYLPESTEHPMLPFKTLVLAAREFKVGRCLTLQSARATFTIRLKEPIEEQGDFAWLPYEVVDRRENEQPAVLRTPDGMAAASSRVQSAPANSDTVVDLVTREPEQRVATAGNP